ncbi:energy-coupling factor transporter ATP-binding protein EcfA2 [Kaistia geumhonensis]|uniref:Energy-coupling factor transporter ATP-binding protein EcfA2 n=1 Tax=Kaistia geumhonensis TaxID=410839 RepID=A0ABU0M2B2_9HYPH|nr:energy-coupling factor transporter ATP-binding protein EcfA2 [Kaistia geumhonensis]
MPERLSAAPPSGKIATMITHAGEILILTGPPGSGKTTAAAQLAALPGSPKVHLHSDDFWGFIRHGAIAPYLPEANTQNRIVMEVLSGVVAGFARGGYFVVLDGIIGPWFLSAFAGIEVPLHYIVLRPDLDEAIARCRSRGGETLTDPATIAALHGQFADLGPLERHALAIGGLDRQRTLESIVEALASGAYRLPPNGAEA